MTQPTQAQIEAALLNAANALDDCRQVITALTAAAEVGEPKQVGEELGYVAKEDFDDWMAHTKAATIERCAQVAEGVPSIGHTAVFGRRIAAAIRALKDQP